MKKALILTTLCTLLLTGCGTSTEEAVEPVMNMTEYAEMTEDTAIEKFGEPDYTDEEYENDGFKGTLCNFDSTELIFDKNEDLYEATFYYDEYPTFESLDSLYDMYGIDSDPDNWLGIGQSGMSLRGTGGTGDLQEFQLFLSDMENGNVEIAKFIFNN